MGNQLSTTQVVAAQQLDYYLHEFPGVVYESSLGKGRFLKTMQCIHDEGTVVVKVYVKRDPNQSIKDQAEKLNEIREYFSLIENPNVLAYRKWHDSDKAGFIFRQYFVNNLYDRISTRPFLTSIEKQWIVYQLLNGLTQCHFYGICHGDIKCENVMVTSWNWIYLADFASYKPTYIPEDNPADFSFYFDSAGRRICYLAPERFYSNSNPEGEITQEMDIFSVGCVIAELFLDGTPIFNFAQLLGYRKGTYDPEPIINRISDPAIQELVKHMIQKDPKKRFSAKKYLTVWLGTAFPSYFASLHAYISKLMKLEPDEKVTMTKMDFNTLLERFAGKDVVLPSSVGKKEESSLFLSSSWSKATPSPDLSALKKVISQEINVNSLEEQDSAFQLLMDTGKYMHRLELDLEKKSPPDTSAMTPAMRDYIGASPDERADAKSASSNPASKGLLAASLSTPLQPPQEETSPGSEGLVILLNTICSFIPTLKYSSTKLAALELFSLFANYLNSEIRLQRIVPYIVHLLSEESALVRATAIRTLASVLEKVDKFPPSDSHVFPAYILPALSKFASEEPEELVREAYAENLALLAEAAKRFLETSQFFKQNTDISTSDKDQLSYQESYDAELTEIQEAFYEVVVEMLTKDTSTAVRRTLLSDITRLCIFFGRQKTNDFLLPLIITFLNDRHDWELRCAFFQNIVGVSAFVGMDSLQLFILPCILQALTDEEEFVIDKAVNSLASLCELGLFRKHVLFDIADKSAPMLYHPNMWIRYGVIALMSAIASQLKLADIHCFLIPTLKPYLVTDIIEINEQNLLEALKPPVPRSAFDAVMTYVFDMISNDASDASFLRRQPSTASFLDKSTSEDPFEVAFKAGLGELGLTVEEQEKLLVMRSFIKFTSFAKKGKVARGQDDDSSSNLSIPVHSVIIPSGARDSSERPKTMSKGKSSAVLTNASFDMKRSTTRLDLYSTSNGSPGSLRVRKNSSDSARPSIPFIKPIFTNPDTPIKGLPTNFPQRLFPPPLPDLGTLTTESLSGETFKDWQPKGILVAHLYEHKASVNQIQVSKDNMFFVSGSDDGSVKVWDSMRLEKNVTNRSRCTYSQGGKIKSLCILENSHSIASGSDNGSIHIYRVDYTTKKDSALHRYTGLTTIKNIDSSEGAIIGLDHFNNDTQSLLVYATSKGKIHSWDLRSKQEPWVLNNAANLGLLTAFVIEPGKNWLVTGTGSGFFTCWDMRFQIPVKTWRHFSKSKIYKLASYNSGNPQYRSCIFATAGNTNEFSVWDVETASCKQLFRILSPSDSTLIPNVKSIDTEISLLNYGMEELQNPIVPQISNVGVKAFLNPPHSNYLLTGGDDRRVRYWDLMNAMNSYTVCGISSEQTKPRYGSHVADNISVYQEVSSIPSLLEDPNTHHLLNPAKAGPASPSVNHHESILDLKLLELPHRMLVSAGRDGVVKVWK